MARIAPVDMQTAGEDVKAAIQYTRQGITALVGRETERMTEPLEVLAHVPGLLRGVGALAQASNETHGLSRRHHALANLKTATLIQCEYCIDIGSRISRQWGLTDAELLALPSFRSSDLFSDLDKLVLEYAVAMTRTPVDVSDDLFARLREHFSEAQMVELTHLIALENLYSRFNHALGIGSSGLSEGMVCAIPATS